MTMADRSRESAGRVEDDRSPFLASRFERKRNFTSIDRNRRSLPTAKMLSHTSNEYIRGVQCGRNEVRK